MSQNLVRDSSERLCFVLAKFDILAHSQSRDLCSKKTENLLWESSQFWNTDRKEDENFTIEKACYKIRDDYMESLFQI